MKFRNFSEKNGKIRNALIPRQSFLAGIFFVPKFVAAKCLTKLKYLWH